MPEDDEIDWLSCLPFEGPEKDLPTGTVLPAGIHASDFILSIKYTKSGGISSLEIDEDLYKEVKVTYPNGVFIANSDGNLMTREDWYYAKGQSDGLKLAIIRELNLQKSGGGVHPHPLHPQPTKEYKRLGKGMVMK